MKGPKSAITSGSETKRRPNRLIADDDDQEISPRGKAIRWAYIMERSRWESFMAGERITYRVPNLYDGKPVSKQEGEHTIRVCKPNIWDKLAGWFFEMMINPEAYISFQFDMLSLEDRHPPEPQQLTSDRYLRLWERDKEKLSERIRVRLLCEKQEAENMAGRLKAGGATDEVAWAYTLNNSGLELSPLFRYCLASMLYGRAFRRIASRNEAGAIAQFERYRRFYKEHWKTLLPQGFSKRSKELYPNLLIR